MLKIIVKGKLDYADGGYLLTEEGTHLTCRLGWFLAPHTGKTIVISLEEEAPVPDRRLEELLEPAYQRQLREEEEPVLNNNFKELLVPA